MKSKLSKDEEPDVGRCHYIWTQKTVILGQCHYICRQCRSVPLYFRPTAIIFAAKGRFLGFHCHYLCSPTNKIGRMAGQISAGITQLAHKAAYYAGANSPRGTSERATLTRQVALVGAVGAVAILTIRTIRQRRRQDSRIVTGFDLDAGQTLTDEFGSTCLSEPALQMALGPSSVSKPVLKMGGEDDVFLGAEPNGHVYYSLPDDGVAQVQAVVPRQGRETTLGQALWKCLRPRKVPA